MDTPTDITTIRLQPFVAPESRLLRVWALIDDDDHIELNSLATLDADHPAGTQVTLHALDFAVDGHDYRVFATTLVGDEQISEPWQPHPDGGCRFTFTMPEQGQSGPRFAMSAVPTRQDSAALLPFISGSKGTAEGLPIQVPSTSGPGPKPG